MLTWLIVILIFGILGVTGYYKGGIRAAVSLVGLCFATFLALPLSPFLRPLVPKVGLANPIWSWVLPPVVVFLVIVLIFTGLAFLVHHKVTLHFKYTTDDYTRLRWERLNQQLGLCMGLVAASIYVLLLGVIVYVFGYPAVQVTSDESPVPQRLLSSVRKELQEGGLDKTLASLDPMPETYYLSSDLIGLLYQNPGLQERLLNYPAFLSLAERSEIKEIAGDVEFLNLWQTRAPILNLVNHPKIQGVIKNAEIVGEIRQVDLKDLHQYLTTGKSAKYDEEKILGRWNLDSSATFTLARKKRPDMSAKDMDKLKTLVGVFLARASLMATPDNKITVKVPLTDEANRLIEAAKAKLAAAAAQAAAAADGAGAPPPMMDPRYPPPRMDPRYRQYLSGGRTPEPSAPEQRPKPAATPKNLPGIPDVNLAGEGSWGREGTRYKLKLTDEQSKTHAGDGTADDEHLLINLDGISSGLQTFAFVR